MTSVSNQNNPPATLNLPASATNGQKQSVSCIFLSKDRNRLLLEAPDRINGSSPVSIEYDDAMFLGEVIRSTRADNGSWQIDIRVEQVLSGLESLINLRSRLLGEGVGASVRPVSVCV